MLHYLHFLLLALFISLSSAVKPTFPFELSGPTQIMRFPYPSPDYYLFPKDAATGYKVLSDYYIISGLGFLEYNLPYEAIVWFDPPPPPSELIWDINYIETPEYQSITFRTTNGFPHIGAFVWNFTMYNQDTAIPIYETGQTWTVKEGSLKLAFKVENVSFTNYNASTTQFQYLMNLRSNTPILDYDNDNPKDSYFSTKIFTTARTIARFGVLDVAQIQDTGALTGIDAGAYDYQFLPGTNDTVLGVSFFFGYPPFHTGLYYDPDISVTVVFDGSESSSSSDEISTDTKIAIIVGSLAGALVMVVTLTIIFTIATFIIRRKRMNEGLELKSALGRESEATSDELTETT